MKNTKFAVTYTIKNEEKIIADAIRYYKHLGCSKFYIFFDGTSDNSRDVILGMDRVVTFESGIYFSDSEVMDWIIEIIPRWHDNMDVRKRINTAYAAKLANNDGIEWLLSIDPDELLVVDAGDGARAEDFLSLLDGISEDVDQIKVKNLEVVVTSPVIGSPFLDCNLFLRRFPATEYCWRIIRFLVSRMGFSSNFVAWLEYFFYYCRFFGKLPRLYRSPVDGNLFPGGYFLGYLGHKSIVRSSRWSLFNFNVHEWIATSRGRPRSVFKYWLLHYDLYSLEGFIGKFSQRQPAMLVKDFVFRFNAAVIARSEIPGAAVNFFEKYIIWGNKKCVDMLIARGVLLRFNAPSIVLRGDVYSEAKSALSQSIPD